MSKHFHNNKVLILSNRNLKEIPRYVFRCKQLRVLYLNGNEITEIPDEIAKLNELQELYVNANQINRIPLAITKLPNLKILNFRDNPIQNPPPVEIVGRGTAAVLNYLREIYSQKEDFIYEAKLLIIGEGGAGKTTLCKKILDREYKLDTSELSTKGIEISPYYFRYRKKNFRTNIWDFGGQEIYHATHQFFLTKRSLYILVSDTRKEDTDFNYWLNIVELLSDNSPIIIVQNEKQDRKREINQKALRGRFSNFSSLKQINLLDCRGLDELLQEVEHQLSSLPHVGSVLPMNWVKIRSILEKIKKPFIKVDRYLKICAQNGIHEESKAMFLSEFLHDIGVHLHFQDNLILRNLVILDSEWATKALYDLIDDEVVIQRYGEFSSQDLDRIWNENSYNRMHRELLELLIKFELVYQIENQRSFVVPALLKINEPDYRWVVDDDLIVRYVYEFMPKGILARLIIRLNRYIYDQDLVWKEGVLLERKEAKAEILQVYEKNEVNIRISGVSKREFLIVIMEELDKIHEGYPKLQVDKLIPCNCLTCQSSSKPHFFKYENIRNRQIKGKATVECEKSFDDIQVESVLKNIFSTGNKVQKFYKIAKKARSLLAEDKTSEVITELTKYFKLTDNTQVLKELVMLSANLQRVQSEYNLNLISNDDFFVEKTKINHSLYEITER